MIALLVFFLSNLYFKFFHIQNLDIITSEINFFTIKEFFTIFIRNCLVSLVFCGLLWKVSKLFFYMMWLLNSIVFGLMISFFNFPINLFLTPVAIFEITALFISRSLFLGNPMENKRKLYLIITILFFSAIYECFVFPHLALIYT